MHTTPGIVERAFELARSGRYLNVQEIIRRLKQEKYDNVEAHLSGTGFRRELQALIRATKAASTPAPASSPE